MGIGMAIYRMSLKNGARGAGIPLHLVEQQLLRSEARRISKPACLLHEMERIAPSNGVEFDLLNEIRPSQIPALSAAVCQDAYDIGTITKSTKEDQRER